MERSKWDITFYVVIHKSALNFYYTTSACLFSKGQKDEPSEGEVKEDDRVGGKHFLLFNDQGSDETDRG